MIHFHVTYPDSAFDVGSEQRMGSQGSGLLTPHGGAAPNVFPHHLLKISQCCHHA